MAAITEPDIVTQIPVAGDVPMAVLLTLDRPVLANAIRRACGESEMPGEAISAFQSFTSQPHV
jgi:FXSXX-COOH protein